MTHLQQPTFNYAAAPPNENWTRAFVKSAYPPSHAQAVDNLFQTIRGLVISYGLVPAHYKRLGYTSRELIHEHRVWVVHNAFPAGYQTSFSIANVADWCERLGVGLLKYQSTSGLTNIGNLVGLPCVLRASSWSGFVVLIFDSLFQLRRL